MRRILKRHVREMEDFIGRCRYARIAPKPALPSRYHTVG